MGRAEAECRKLSWVACEGTRQCYILKINAGRLVLAWIAVDGDYIAVNGPFDYAATKSFVLSPGAAMLRHQVCVMLASCNSRDRYRSAAEPGK